MFTILSKLVTAMISALFISIGLSFITPGYFIIYFLAAGLIYVLLGIPVSLFIDYSLRNKHLSKVRNHMTSMTLHTIAGAIFGAGLIMFIEPTPHVIWTNVFLLGAISGLLFHLNQLMSSILKLLIEDKLLK